MTNLQTKKTGPISPAGKKRSSMNARIHGLYSSSLLPSERPEDFRSLVASLSRDWRVQCSTGESLVNQLAALTYRQARFERARSAVSESTFADLQSIKDFCTATGIGEDHAHRLPRWFFDEDPEALQRCELAFQIHDQAKYLVSNYTLNLAEMACTELPQLWREVMGSPGPNFKTSITQRMCQIHGCESPEDAAKLHIEVIANTYRYELMWMRKRKIIETVKQKMRASKTLFALSRADWLKAEAQINRQATEIIRQLVALSNFHTQGADVIEG
jgi:hypothetical protein